MPVLERAALPFVAGLLLIAAATAPERVRLESTLRLDQLQMLGSHNSYRPYPSPAIEAAIRKAAPAEWPGLACGHPPLEVQLALGLRQFELDLMPDPQGGRFLAPHSDASPAILAAMRAPGAKVLHVPPVDIESHCPTFRQCLVIFRRWSDAHPGHLPITILANTRDANDAARFDAAALDALDRDIVETLSADRLITPDEVRGRHATLRGAVEARAWPTLAAARGRFLLVLDGSAAHNDAYSRGHASLAGRVMFGFYPESSDEAALMNIQDPGATGDAIRSLVKRGFLVRTRADAGAAEARANDPRRLNVALASGAQFISTDFYEGAPNPAGYRYRAALPEGGTIRCNRVTAHCRK